VDPETASFSKLHKLLYIIDNMLRLMDYPSIFTFYWK